MDTIVAVATKLPGPIGIIRISGDKAEQLLNAVFKTREPNEPKKMRVGIIDTEIIKDKVNAVFFKAPNSFTGEDTAEIYFHGSVAIASEIIRFLINKGARAAKPGEFSLRAYLNNKLDLSAAEGIVNLINAETATQARAAYNLSDGVLKEEIERLQCRLKEVIALIEAGIDYPEEDLESESYEVVLDIIDRDIKEIEKLKQTFETGKLIKNGVRVVITGEVNVGKSQLINALVNRDRAIVTDVAGTTRDIIEDYYEYKGIKFIVTDTAGIRETSDKIERMGIIKAGEAIKSADVVLAVTEAGKEFNNKTMDFISKESENRKIIYVENKTDIFKAFKINSVKISALKAVNIDLLKEEIFKASQLDEYKEDEVIITDLRHYECLSRCIIALREADKNLQNECTAECIAVDLMEAYNALGQITGVIGSEEIINEIFSKFCVGK